MPIRFLFLILNLMLTVLLTGCWGRQELNSVAIIHTIAVDQEKNNLVRLTVEISDLKSQSQGGPAGLSGKSIYLTSTGHSIFEAARNLRNSSSRHLIWGHVNAIIFSKKMAQEGLRKNFDTLIRLRHFRNTMNVFIANGKASDIFRASIPQQSYISIGLRGLEEAQHSTANTRRVTLMQVGEALTNKYKTLTIPAVELFKLPKTSKESLRSLGVFTFKDDKLFSLMDVVKTKAYVRAINEAKSAVEILPCGTGNDYATFENVRNHTKITSKLQDNHPTITMEMLPEFDIVEVQCGEKITSNQLTKWEEQLNSRITLQNQDLIRYSQKNNLDLLGIGEVIHREHPQEWKNMKKNWRQIYPNLQIQIVVKSRIDHSNLSS
ncbi:Ger(x)C family spore germination protein [Brevibacillus ginsengisoli]|uniref:Ger(x)C family spore germination protein n=1 Tax=Brevibacillus ginsengisoli TaxID=363854 RepID=UPI003CF49BCF